MENKVFTVLKNGEKIYYDVILTFRSNTTNKDYIVYTDNTYDEDNKLKIYAAIYNADTFEFISSDLTNEDWIEVNNMLEYYL